MVSSCHRALHDVLVFTVYLRPGGPLQLVTQPAWCEFTTWTKATLRAEEHPQAPKTASTSSSTFAEGTVDLTVFPA
jgi:hypothetical protein